MMDGVGVSGFQLENWWLGTLKNKATRHAAVQAF
jgi:hypothetical protein